MTSSIVRMRSWLGRVAGVASAVGLVVIGASVVSAAPPDSSVPPPSDPTTTAPTTTTTTTTIAPTTTPPPNLVAERPATPVTPSRGSQIQVTPTNPPPSTTTTTTIPPEEVLPANSGSGRRVVYDKNRQRVWTVEEDGTVSKTHLVSGRLTWNQPLPGTYEVFSRSRHTCNIKNPHICWGYMVRFTKGPGGDNIGFHEIPTNLQTGAKLQSESQLGTALSAGCVRQRASDASGTADPSGNSSTASKKKPGCARTAFCPSAPLWWTAAAMTLAPARRCPARS